MNNFWMVRAGERGVLARTFEEHAGVAVGWVRSGDVGPLETTEAIRARIDERYAEDSVFRRGQSAGQLHRFRNEITPGDRVVTFDGARREYLVGAVTGDYEYQPELIPGYPHLRRVAWEARVPRDLLRQHSLNTLGSLLTIFEPGEEVWRDLEDARRSAPEPSASGVQGESRSHRRIDSLFAKFEKEYLTTDAGARHRAAYEAGRLSGRANYEEIVRRADASEDVTDLVLSRLLPHTDSARHREQGDWIHVAPSIQMDVRSWFEGAGWAAAEEWPDRARHILNFVRRVVDNPGDLAAACAEFTASPLSRGFQGGMLTPILSVLRPEDYALVNSKACKLLEALTGERSSSSLAEYPRTNTRILAVVEANRDTFGRAAPADVSSLEAFDMMAHWYVAVRKPDDEDEDEDFDDGPRIVDRASAADAQRVLEAVCPDPAPRAVALDTFARSVRLAHQTAPSSWSVTLKPRLLRLNVGGILVLDIEPDGLTLVVHQDSLDRSMRRRLERHERYTFNYLPSTVGYLIPFNELDPTLTLLQGAHEELVRRVVAKTTKAPFRSAHSPGILKMLREAGHAVPDPGWADRRPVIDPPPPLPPRPPRPVHPEFTLEQAASETHLDAETLGAWVRAINRKGQAILYGPPGTGKTYVAERLRRHLLSGGDGHTDLVQFHPAYAYEDFIQGLRPLATPDGRLTYQMVPGRFVEFCEAAAERAGVSVLIIDEINRANLAQVFGELMYLLEYRDRELPLAGGGRLRIPPKVRIIGTMNTADRSIALVDHALRRRFAFLRLDPKLEVLTRFHASFDQDVGGLAEVLVELNGRIADPHYAVGISYFLRESLSADLEAIWTGEIEPYVEELFFDRKAEIDRFRWTAVRTRVQPLPLG
jgi:hypothetical protein